MRKVVDSNLLQSELLRQYLSASPRNQAVLTDYSAIEAYKTGTADTIYRSMQILSEFPRQVVVLKATDEISRLYPYRLFLRRRMIDGGVTRGFRRYCQGVRLAKLGDIRVRDDLARRMQRASAHMERLLGDASNFAQIVDDLGRVFTASELRTLRSNAPHTESMDRKFVAIVVKLAQRGFAVHQKNHIPTWDMMPNTLVFRVMLCACFLALRWLSVGGAGNVKPKNLRNDMVDICFAAYATFFDGLLSQDAKCVSIYGEAMGFLRQIGHA